MNPRIKDLMLEHGLHKHISRECQDRMEFFKNNYTVEPSDKELKRYLEEEV